MTRMLQRMDVLAKVSDPGRRPVCRAWGKGCSKHWGP